MTLFDVLLIINMLLVLIRQFLIAHNSILNFHVALVLDVLFFIAYSSANIVSGQIFSVVHALSCVYGYYKWK